MPYNRTNVRDDPRYWEAQLTHLNPAIRHEAQVNLERLQQQRVLGQNAAQFRENIDARLQGQSNVERARRDTLAENRRVHADTKAQRELESRRLEAYRRSQLGERDEAQQTRKDLGLLNLAQSPELMTAYGKQAPAIQKELLNRYFATLQGGGAAGAGPAGGTALATMGGSAATNPADAALRKMYQDQGRTTAPSPTTVAPSAAAAKAQGQPPAPTGADFAPSELYGDEETTTAPEAPTQIGGSPIMPANRLIQHGQIVGGPAGYDLNVNTGEYVPSNYEGAINGLPVGEAIARGAIKTGIAPESPRGIAALRTKQNAIAGGVPTLNEELAVNSGMAPTTLVQQGATNKPFMGSPELFSPEAAPVPQAAPQVVREGPGPAPTPGGTPAPALGITKFENAPVPVPTPHRPPPVPMPGQSAPPPAQVAVNTPAPQVTPTPEPMNFNDVVEQVPPPAPENMPSNLLRPRSPNEVVVRGEVPMIPQELPPNIVKPLDAQQLAAIEEQRRRMLY
jgi:hypothetical protein